MNKQDTGKIWVYLLGVAVVIISGLVWTVSYGPLSFVGGYFLAPPDRPQGTISLFEPDDGLKYMVYVPPDYAPGADHRYPVIYHLHGAMPVPWFVARGMINADVRALANVMEALVAADEAQATIIVAPYDGLGLTMWSNSSSGHQLAESGFIDGVMPAITRNYAIDPRAESTFIQGFSMGGFGALKIGMKYNDRFAKITSWDGAIHSWQTLTANRPGIAQNMFASKADFDRHSPWTIADRYATLEITAPVEIHLFSGKLAATSQYNRAFSKHLTALNIDHQHEITQCQHEPFCFMATTRVRDIYGNN